MCIRDRCGDILIRPYSSPWKIYIVDEAEKMTVQAQNALLKTIEEPPAYGIILLLTENSQSFLPTILSRCVTLKLRPVKEELIRKYLMEELHVPDYQADVCASFARGNVGKAKRLAQSEHFAELRDEVIHLMRHLRDMEIYEVTEAVRELSLIPILSENLSDDGPGAGYEDDSGCAGHYGDHGGSRNRDEFIYLQGGDGYLGQACAGG